MSLLAVILILIGAGICVWAIRRIKILDADWKTFISIVVMVAAIFWVLALFGVFTAVNSVPVPRIR